MITNKIIIGSFSSIILFGIFFNYGKNLIAEGRLRDIATKDIHQILETRGTESFTAPQPNDPWGVPYRTSAEGGSITKFSVYSAGPDKQFDTSDDLKESNSDLNWTNAGSSIGQKTGRMARGFFKGLWDSGDGK